MGLISGIPGVTAPEGTQEGQILEWNGTLWEVKRQTLSNWWIGFTTLPALASFFVTPDALLGTEVAAWVIPHDCTVDRFYSFHGNAGNGSAATITYTVRKNAVNTALVIGPIATNFAQPVSDLTNSVDFNAGDTMTIGVSWPAALAQTIRPSWALRLISRVRTQ